MAACGPEPWPASASRHPFGMRKRRGGTSRRRAQDAMRARTDRDIRFTEDRVKTRQGTSRRIVPACGPVWHTASGARRRSQGLKPARRGRVNADQEWAGGARARAAVKASLTPPGETYAAAGPRTSTRGRLTGAADARASDILPEHRAHVVSPCPVSWAPLCASTPIAASPRMKWGACHDAEIPSSTYSAAANTVRDDRNRDMTLIIPCSTASGFSVKSLQKGEPATHPRQNGGSFTRNIFGQFLPVR